MCDRSTAVGISSAIFRNLSVVILRDLCLTRRRPATAGECVYDFHFILRSSSFSLYLRQPAVRSGCPFSPSYASRAPGGFADANSICGNRIGVRTTLGPMRFRVARHKRGETRVASSLSGQLRSDEKFFRYKPKSLDQIWDFAGDTPATQSAAGIIFFYVRPFRREMCAHRRG